MKLLAWLLARLRRPQPTLTATPPPRPTPPLPLLAPPTEAEQATRAAQQSAYY